MVVIKLFSVEGRTIAHRLLQLRWKDPYEWALIFLKTGKKSMREKYIKNT